jgi:hypothetical protein
MDKALDGHPGGEGEEEIGWLLEVRQIIIIISWSIPTLKATKSSCSTD